MISILASVVHCQPVVRAGGCRSLPAEDLCVSEFLLGKGHLEFHPLLEQILQKAKQESSKAASIRVGAALDINIKANVDR